MPYHLDVAGLWGEEGAKGNFGISSLDAWEDAGHTGELNLGTAAPKRPVTRVQRVL